MGIKELKGIKLGQSHEQNVLFGETNKIGTYMKTI